MALCSTPDKFLPKNVLHIVNTLKITHLHLTPTLASFLTPDQVPSVRYLLTSGEPLTAKVHQNWAEKGLNHGIHQYATLNAAETLETVLI